MNARTLTLYLAGTGALALLVRALTSQTTPAAAPPAPPPHSPLAPVVAKTLHKHEGEASPMVEAFEHALQQEAKHGSGLA